MGETEEFNTLAFEKKLTQLKDTQESIQSLSSWCLKQRAHHKKIVSSWLNVLKRVKVEQRLVLFYLANDVIQYSKRKNYEFVESWGLNLQKATPLVRDEKVRHKIVRIFKIWELRSVYDDEFLTDLTGLLSAGAIKKTEDDALDFQPQQLVNKIKQCSVLEADTDLRLKYIHESHLQLSDADALCASLKDRRNKDDVEKELSEGIACVERYTQALQREIVARESLLALLTSASQYYSTQRGEVKVVAYAYKNFGARVRALKRKLDELIPTLPNAAPSPPVCDEDVPSPGPDEDLDLPNTTDTGDDEVSYNIDKTFNTSLTADGSLYNLGLSSFLSSENPMSIFNNDPPTTTNSNANKIEVISSRPSENQDFLNDILKTLIPNDNTTTSDNNSVASGTMSQKSQDTLPGLDLLTPESTGNAPPISFYGAMDHINDEPEQPYHTASNTDPWSTNVQTWSVPTPVPPPPISTIQSLSSFTSVPSLSSLPSLPPLSSLPIFADTPESPPPAPLSMPPVLAENQLYTPDLPPADVDHRGVLPPPPPPPVLPGLGHMEDVDHRMLPTLPPLPPTAVPPPTRHSGGSQDVDHRNLISLTNQMPPPRQLNAVNMDQDYRVPPMVPHPSDIVESVDMDLSEDEDQLGTYQNQQSQSDLNRRQSFNNKVLVGGNNGKTNHEQQNTNLIRINSIPNAEPKKVDKVEAPLTAPILQPLSNPFDNMPMELKSFNMPFPPKLPDIPLNLDDDIEEKTELYDEDLRSRGQENFKSPKERNPSPPSYETYDPGMAIETNWETQSPQRPFMNRFPRNWTPRSNFRQQFIPQQFWPRNVPRTPNRWMGPRPQRFW